MYTYCGFEQVKHLPAAESEVFQSIILITEILRLMVAMCHRLKWYIHLCPHFLAKEMEIECSTYTTPRVWCPLSC